jgi:AcrR family transcriptional regulator
MTTTADPTASPLNAPVRASEPRERLLRTAASIFYSDGIHSVGVDRVIAEAGVTRATFYRHFPGKEDLVLAYLELEDGQLRDLFETAAIGIDDPEQLLEAIIAGIADDVTYGHTRGCPFINASAEYPDSTSRVRILVREHRDWFQSTLRAALEKAGRTDAAARGRALSLLRDAALVGSYLDGPATIRDSFIATARQVAGLA